MPSLPRLAVPVTALALAAFAAGCGEDVAVQEVPGGPVQLTVPGNAEGLAPAPTATAEATAEATATAPAAATVAPEQPGPSDPGGAAAQGGTAEGGTAAPDAPSGEQPPAGSDVEQFETFCAQNPGAC
jgi:hypothetical protein